MSRPLVSVHFPKAAGSSLAKQLRDFYQDALSLDYDHDPLGPNAAEQADTLYPGARAVHGHFAARRYEALPDAMFITVLREPLDNLMSIYFFWKGYPAHGNPIHDRFVAEAPSFEDFSRYPEMSRLMSERYFGGFDMDRFDMVGFHETRDQDIPRLGALLGAPLKAEIYENRTSGEHEQARQEILADLAQCARVRGNLRHDIAFYEAQRAKRA
ncbi:hypothetical protein [Caulobacter hibisci]|uniref:Sulfotransferase family protein n=1 Tax=Caulobacter hibisci TaxID=2035993 RepID=A0ABS0SV61_9CAUL|nr:hypothetical protein [Caulobacter hibisci]MBI1683294.1 hypothetical protein [Caulobacter hibisci]